MQYRIAIHRTLSPSLLRLGRELANVRVSIPMARSRPKQLETGSLRSRVAAKPLQPHNPKAQPKPSSCSPKHIHVFQRPMPLYSQVADQNNNKSLSGFKAQSLRFVWDLLQDTYVKELHGMQGLRKTGSDNLAQPLGLGAIDETK